MSMDKIFFEELNLRDCDYTLNIGSGTHAQQTGKMLMKIEEVLIDEKPDIVLVQGDTNYNTCRSTRGFKTPNTRGTC